MAPGYATAIKRIKRTPFRLVYLVESSGLHRNGNDENRRATLSHRLRPSRAFTYNSCVIVCFVVVAVRTNNGREKGGPFSTMTKSLDDIGNAFSVT